MSPIFQLMLYIDGEARSKNEGWNITDGWITVSNATSKVSIRYEILEPPSPRDDDGNSDQTLLGHLVIATILVIRITFIVLLRKTIPSFKEMKLRWYFCM